MNSSAGVAGGSSGTWGARACESVIKMVEGTGAASVGMVADVIEMLVGIIEMLSGVRAASVGGVNGAGLGRVA